MSLFYYTPVCSSIYLTFLNLGDSDQAGITETWKAAHRDFYTPETRSSDQKTIIDLKKQFFQALICVGSHVLLPPQLVRK